ncbi:MAG: NUDIX domain-containing protein [Lachnospiraceae bacterium]|nr:NUDIX domain-containing protein [Lachnospiraceae bacterium]
MTEFWDVYDGNGSRTGRIMERGTPADGDYMLCVHVYLHTPDGRFLMQKRSEDKQSHPGIWDVTGGAVQAGEKSIEGAIRETEEEIGITLEEKNLTYVGRIKKRRSFIHIYFAKKDFEERDCVLQTDEVSEICLVDSDEVLRIEREERKREPEYMALLQAAMAKYTGN